MRGSALLALDYSLVQRCDGVRSIRLQPTLPVHESDLSGSLGRAGLLGNNIFAIYERMANILAMIFSNFLVNNSGTISLPN